MWSCDSGDSCDSATRVTRRLGDLKGYERGMKQRMCGQYEELSREDTFLEGSVRRGGAQGHEECMTKTNGLTFCVNGQ